MTLFYSLYYEVAILHSIRSPILDSGFPVYSTDNIQQILLHIIQRMLIMGLLHTLRWPFRNTRQRYCVVQLQVTCLLNVLGYMDTLSKILSRSKSLCTYSVTYDCLSDIDLCQYPYYDHTLLGTTRSFTN